MNKNTLIALLGTAVGLLSLALIVTEIRNRPPKPTRENVGTTWVDPKTGVTNVVIKTESVCDGVKTNSIVELAPVQRSVERRPLEPEATKRLHDGPVIVLSVFEASGKAEYAEYGLARRGSYLYTTTVMAQSEIIDKKEEAETGRVFVRERRKFLEARDNISLSEIDAAIALETLPVDQVKNYANGTCHLVSSVCTMLAPMIPPAAPFLMIGAAGSEAFNLAVDETFKMLYSIDNVSVRGLLGAFGVKIPENIDRFVSERMAKSIKEKMRKVHFALQTIEGKSFIITYEQEKNGAPLNVDYRNEDGSPITDAEWEILRSANAFLDSNVVPDTSYNVGASWTVWADEVQELFGVVGNGRTEGRIRIVRTEDQPSGEWTLKIEPTEIEYTNENGSVAGKMKVKDGNGLVDAENVSVKSLQATAEGNLRSLNKQRHFLFFDFITRIKGDSNLRFTLTVDPANPAK